MSSNHQDERMSDSKFDDLSLSDCHGSLSRPEHEAMSVPTSDNRMSQLSEAEKDAVQNIMASILSNEIADMVKAQYDGNTPRDAENTTPHAQAAVLPSAEGVSHSSARTDLQKRSQDNALKPYTREAYYKRNFNWIRCHGWSMHRYSMGGGWMGPWGQHWLKELQSLGCGVINWEFSYVNQHGWGDGFARFNFFWGSCSKQDVVDIAVEMARDAFRLTKRRLYVYSCDGFHDGIAA